MQVFLYVPLLISSLVPWCFHSSHSWCPSPALCFSVLSPNLLCFHLSLPTSLSVLLLSVSLSQTFSSGSSSLLVSCLPSSVWEDWHSSERTIKCYFAPGSFQADSTCFRSPEEVVWSSWAVEGQTSKKDGYFLDKIRGRGGYFRGTTAVGTKERWVETLNLLGLGIAVSWCWHSVRKDVDLSWFELLDWITPGCIIDFDMWPLDLS